MTENEFNQVIQNASVNFSKKVQNRLYRIFVLNQKASDVAESENISKQAVSEAANKFKEQEQLFKEQSNEVTDFYQFEVDEDKIDAVVAEIEQAIAGIKK
ncbi:MAG: hypothetical protein U9N57_01175 [Pseudomonadota bacterium]|nr:hypothetical protein [Pseudomonadota bacterium]